MPQPPTPFDPSIIDRAPIEPDPQDFDPDESDFYVELAGQLASENEALRAELDALKGKKTYDDVRADLMEPYAKRVYRFLIGYCVVVTLILLAQGFKWWNFNLPESVLAVLAGSTAAAAIGLVGFVVSGLFKAKGD